MADRQPRTELSSESATSSPRSSTDSRSPPVRNPSKRLSHISANRLSFTDGLRGVPQSPRARRQPSQTQSAIQSLIDNPPVRNPADPAFAGRDWKQICIGELVSPDDLKFVELDTSIEEAATLLIDSGLSVLLIRETAQDTSVVGTFDYSDLNSYLLLAVGLIHPDEEHITSFRELVQKARDGSKIPLRDVRDLWRKEPLMTLPHSANLMTVVETLGGGVHRIVVTKENSTEVVGIFSQWKLVKFLWENARSFPVIDQLYPQYLKDLQLGSQQVVAISGDKPLSDALKLMNNEGISSIAVVDHHHNVIGNISTVDVKLLTKSSSLPLLRDTCAHFISVILSTRGMNEGKDSFPVFYVNPTSTLAHTVAKLVATESHRLWVTDPHSPSSSGPPTPSHSSFHVSHPTPANPPAANSAAQPLSAPPSASNGQSTAPPTPNYTYSHAPASSPGLPPSITSSIPASSLPGARRSGRLVGLVSLTDILNLYARASGLNPADPAEFRSRRRRSSSSSVSVRKSGDIGRELGLSGRGP